MRDMKMKILVLLILQTVLSESANINTKPSYEVNEQTRTEEKKSQIIPGSLPYGNPLAGNLLQNAKLHAKNQQAMFQAERVRQHRVQLQRWAKQHQPTDSYIKAYHETQENQQLAMEQQQSMINEKKLMMPMNKENRKRMKIPELTKITKEDAITDPEKRRNHRSYDSIEYNRYFQPAKQQNVYISSGPSYDQGVTIKPNGITYLNTQQPNKLYTEAIENKIQYAYPKQNQIHYEFVEDISSLNALLKKSPQEQLTGLNAMTHIDEEKKGTMKTPITVYTYIQEPRSTENYVQAYTQNPLHYGNSFTDESQVKDHKPINEYVDDIEDPNKSTTIKAFGLQSILTTQGPEQDRSTGSPLNTASPPTVYHLNIQSEGVSPEVYQTLNQEQPVYFNEGIKNSDPEDIYLHQTDNPKGVHRLQQDGKEISAYDEESVSILGNIRNRRAIVETDLSINTAKSNKSDVGETLPTPEQLIRHPLVRETPHYRPNYDEDYDYDLPKKHYEATYDYENYDQDDYELSDYGYNNPVHKFSSQFTSPQRVKEGLDLRSSHSRYNPKRHTPIHGTDLNDFSTSYGVPYEVYNPEYSFPKHSIINSESSVPYSTHFQHPEPVYILTESHLKLLLNQPNLNEFQWGKGKIQRPRRFKKRYRVKIPRYLQKNLSKLNKLTML